MAPPEPGEVVAGSGGVGAVVFVGCVGGKVIPMPIPPPGELVTTTGICVGPPVGAVVGSEEVGGSVGGRVGGAVGWNVGVSVAGTVVVGATGGGADGDAVGTPVSGAELAIEGGKVGDSVSGGADAMVSS